MHLFNKCCIYPVTNYPCCYPLPQPYCLQGQFYQGQYSYGQEALRYRRQQAQYPTQETAPLFDNRPGPSAKG